MKSALRIPTQVQSHTLKTLAATRPTACADVQSAQLRGYVGMRSHSITIRKIAAPKIAEYPRWGVIHPPIVSKIVEVTFSLDRPGAQEVYLCGDFNEWSPTSLRMIRHGPGDHWAKRITLAPGRYEYKFVVDGEWMNDPCALENVPNQLGSLNSVMEVHK